MHYVCSTRLLLATDLVFSDLKSEFCATDGHADLTNAHGLTFIFSLVTLIVKVYCTDEKSKQIFPHKTAWPFHTSDSVKLYHSSSLCAICSQQVGCHGSPSFSILCHSDTVIIWHFCPFLDVIRPHTIYPSFHQQSLYPISSYYMSKILTFPFFDSI